MDKFKFTPLMLAFQDAVPVETTLTPKTTVESHKTPSMLRRRCCAVDADTSKPLKSTRNDSTKKRR